MYDNNNKSILYSETSVFLFSIHSACNFYFLDLSFFFCCLWYNVNSFHIKIKQIYCIRFSIWIGSCLSYGHSCWGAHGKRAMNDIVKNADGIRSPNNRIEDYSKQNRWAIFKMMRDEVNSFPFLLKQIWTANKNENKNLFFIFNIRMMIFLAVIDLFGIHQMIHMIIWSKIFSIYY